MSGAEGPDPKAYLSVVEDGARRYLAFLRALILQAPRSPRGMALREVAQPLTQTLEHVLRTRRLAAGEIQIPWGPFARGGGHPELSNTWSVGLGNPLAPLVSLGPEPRYDLDTLEFLLEGLLLQVLWLANAEVHVAAGLLGRPAWSELPFQRYPNDLYEEPTRGTWGRLASLLALAWGSTPRELLRPKRVASNASPYLLDDVYLLNLSTVPRAWKSSAATPVGEREAFLGELLASMPEAKLLLIHGAPDDPEWIAVQRRLAARFLGFPVRDLQDCLQTERPTRTWDELRWFLHGDRGVLFTVPLLHEVAEGYWERAAEILRMILPERPLPP